MARNLGALVRPTPSSGRPADCLGLGEDLQALDAALPADPGALVATEGGVGAVPLATVDGEGAGADPAGYGPGPVQVTGGDRPGQPVVGVVGDAHGVVVVLERDHHQHRAEDLLTGDGHVVGDVGE